MFTWGDNVTSKLGTLLTSWKMIKMLQNFAEVSFSIKLTKKSKKGMELWTFNGSQWFTVSITP